MNFEPGQEAIIDVDAKGLSQKFVWNHGSECTVIGNKSETQYRIKMKNTGIETNIRKEWLLPKSIASEAEEL